MKTTVEFSPTVEDEFKSYKALQERDPATIDFIELEYGQLSEDFMQCNGYRVDLSTTKLVFSYPDPSEPGAPPVYQKPLTEQVAALQKELSATNDQTLTAMSALADVFEMVLSLQDQIAGGAST